jgi:CRP-like cAMP-binding protein
VSLILQHLSRFITLDREETGYFESILVRKKIRRRQYLIQEGDVVKYEHFVSKGCLRSYEIDEKGQEHVIQFAVEGWWTGDLQSFLSGDPTTLNIDALEDSELELISKPALEQLYERVPKFERYFRILIQNAFISTNRRVLNAMKLSALERYQAFISRYPDIEQRVPNHQIASYLGITPQSLSRVRSQYQEQSG